MLLNFGKALLVKTKCRNISSWSLVFYTRLISGLGLFIFLLLTKQNLVESSVFWMITLSTSLLSILASILYINSVKEGDLILVTPIQASIPIFMIGCTFLIYNELPDPKSFFFIGVIISTICYSLARTIQEKNNQGCNKSWIPLVEAIIACALFGISTVLDRMAISESTSGAIAYSAYWNLITAFVLVPLLFKEQHSLYLNLLSERQHLNSLNLYSLVATLAFLLQQLAVQWSLEIPNGVTYVKVVIMMHITLNIIAGIFLFKERVKPDITIASFLTFLGGVGLIFSRL